VGGRGLGDQDHQLIRRIYSFTRGILRGKWGGSQRASSRDSEVNQLRGSGASEDPNETIWGRKVIKIKHQKKKKKKNENTKKRKKSASPRNKRRAFSGIVGQKTGDQSVRREKANVKGKRRGGDRSFWASRPLGGLRIYNLERKT